MKDNEDLCYTDDLSPGLIDALDLHQAIGIEASVNVYGCAESTFPFLRRVCIRRGLHGRGFDDSNQLQEKIAVMQRRFGTALHQSQLRIFGDCSRRKSNQEANENGFHSRLMRLPPLVVNSRP